MKRLRAALLAVPLLFAGCTVEAGAEPGGAPSSDATAQAAAAPANWIYQLSGYEDDRLDALTAAPHEAAVIDLARDGGEGYFTADEIAGLQDSGKAVYAYFTMGSIETYRPEYPAVAETGLVLNHWGDWPDEYFARYWDPRWWDLVMEPRLDRAAAAGFDGVYLDVPNAYEEIDLSLVPGETRESLARKMADLVIAADAYAGEDLQILVQNSPELREFPGYLDAIDGIGVEELFFLATDVPCAEDWCAENLDDTRAIRDAGKLVLAVDYASREANVAAACARYEEEGFAGAVAGVDLDAIYPPCE
ncbi:endo alpha-1,4 polygalactosaminidase [Glycomyces sp. TRM65418]|uniref:endo alpha-1,4 polygalactosaminidase n=1 Tax=Glycomyces sp. TRM65418 TaxID=2867006 RepID=UPI001CE594B7|nr:endo alpha-1,4 polygalactosaminidase [Glycomyces sp. TRM65418]MCC3765953.1 endo alpha-1,4 polygalactosaminidase [Glycomyces sp. TRM65418]QZD55534.1 endo alpha-1,4 polygalactosaminidase [Glycomyces sp. TRM65418]